MRKIMFVVGIAFFTGSVFASISYDVYAYDNSLANTPLITMYFNVGDVLSIYVAEDDIWSAGPADRTSNANGLGPNNPYGGNYGPYGSFYYGSLVGQIDNGSYFFIGTSYNGLVTEAGYLKLIYWDENYVDNSGYVTAYFPVPEPVSFSLLSIGAMGLLMRRRNT
jgi:hypothetical protein